jgi:CheY-like chemotaxis protein
MTDIELVVATGPREGIELARGLRPGLILLDINLPEMDGFEVLKVLRNDEHTADIPVFAVTSNALPKDLERGVAAGFDHYLVKPLNIPQFIAAVDVALTQPPARRVKRVRVKREGAAPSPANGEALAVKQPTPLVAKASLLAGKLTPTRIMKKPAAKPQPLADNVPSPNTPTTTGS